MAMTDRRENEASPWSPHECADWHYGGCSLCDRLAHAVTVTRSDVHEARRAAGRRAPEHYEPTPDVAALAAAMRALDDDAFFYILHATIHEGDSRR